MTALFLVLWNRGGRLALCMNKKDSGEHPFPKIKIPVSTRRPGFFLNQIRSAPAFRGTPKVNQCYFICIIFFVAEAVAVSNV
jgi:hypothetical protein